ncbi:hypothetical protein Misp03_41290 [Microbispora sp. NBRC 16548]|nr:hypothetical protein Misp03_41290 [Microbispora sp. NBRC 16548]
MFPLREQPVVRGGDMCEGGSIGQIGFTLIEDIQAATVALRTHEPPSMTSRGCFTEYGPLSSSGHWILGYPCFLSLLIKQHKAFESH